MTSQGCLHREESVVKVQLLTIRDRTLYCGDCAQYTEQAYLVVFTRSKTVNLCFSCSEKLLHALQAIPQLNLKEVTRD